MKRSLLLALSAILFIPELFAQLAPGQIYFEDPTPAVVMNGSSPQKYPWSGGLNNPQFCMADLNKDGVKDMVIFEPRNGVKTFINTSSVAGNPNYVYKPEYAANFPIIVDYLKLEDYNRDGIPDLFHRSMPGVGVYKGYYNSQNQLCFTKFKDLYYFHPTGGWYNVYISPIDIPAIIDVDFDGDLDILSYDIWGSVINYYRNCQVEDGLPKDSIRICLKDICWGRIGQYWERSLALGFSCSQAGTTCKSTKTTHSGNTLCLIDMDGDGDYDAFNGNVSFSDIQFLKNGKKEYSLGIDSIVSQDTVWSSHGKIMIMPTMPMAFWLDVDNDGDKDLLFSPRTENAENRKNVVYYKNVGSNASPDFVYQSDSFMVGDMIDAGAGSTPVFYDYNKDGKPDLFVGCEGIYQPSTGAMRTAVKYYENQSTATQSKFVLMNDDFLGLYAGNTKGSAMSMGDIDGDGIDDLIMGKTDGTVHFYKNYAASNTVQPNWQFSMALNDASGAMDVGDYAMPFVYDLNKDGKKDLIIGCQMGRLYYYRNMGLGGTTPIFNKITDTLGGIVITESSNFYSYASPIISKIDTGGKEYLLIGSKGGSIYRYDGFQGGNVTGKYTRLDSNFSKISTKDRATPAMADINGDGRYDLVIGSSLGGLYAYRQFYGEGVEQTMLEDNQVVLYPNPAKDILNITWKDGFARGDVQVSIISSTGQTVWRSTIPSNSSSTEVNTSSLAAGMYYCILQSGGNRTAAPVSILK